MMKKIAPICILLLVVLVTGCSWGGNKKTSITETKFSVESCNKYFKLMECVLENDSDATYTDEQREEIRKEVIKIQEQWSKLDNDILKDSCDAELARFESNSEAFSQIGCPLN